MNKILIGMILTSIIVFSKEHSMVLLETNEGNVTLELYNEIAPLAVENFTTHIKNGYYNNTSFHRIIKDFMIQGGDPKGDGTGGESIWGKPFKDEFKSGYAFNRPYLLAMANSGKNTNKSQFFITTGKPFYLSGVHTIFGEVIEGFETIDKLNLTGTEGEKGKDKPIEYKYIINSKILNNKIIKESKIQETKKSFFGFF